MSFRNRHEAAVRLCALLKKVVTVDSLVLAIPRGGVPIAHIIARQFHIPLQLLFVKKISHPTNRELAIGAAGLETYILEHPHDASELFIQSELRRVRSRMREQMEFTGCEFDPREWRGRQCIIVDDGMATGSTMKCAVRIVALERPRKIIVAVPVASTQAINEIGLSVDDVACLIQTDSLNAIGEFYTDFSQVSDAEVKKILQQYREDSAC